MKKNLVSALLNCNKLYNIMFTGIIENLGEITNIKKENSNITFTINAPFTNELKVDQSVAHNGICLTIETIAGNEYTVTAIEETIKKTTIGFIEIGQMINLERCLQYNGRLDGHIVQGHVDTTGTCIGYEEKDGSWEYVINIAEEFATLIIEKGSICLNGISLTIFNITNNTFTIAIIPYTYHHTNMKQLSIGNNVNIEFDMIGKYVNRMNEIKSTK